MLLTCVCHSRKAKGGWPPGEGRRRIGPGSALAGNHTLSSRLKGPPLRIQEVVHKTPGASCAQHTHTPARTSPPPHPRRSPWSASVSSWRRW